MILNKQEFGATYFSDWRGKLWLCGEELGKVFTIPKYVNTIWVTLRDRGTESAAAVRINVSGLADARVDVEDGDAWRCVDVGWCVARLLRKHLGNRKKRTLYVEVEYEVP